MTCDCLLKYQNGGVCNCELSQEDVMDILGFNDNENDDDNENDNDYEEEQEEKEKDRFTKDSDKWSL